MRKRPAELDDADRFVRPMGVPDGIDCAAPGSFVDVDHARHMAAHVQFQAAYRDRLAEDVQRDRDAVARLGVITGFLLGAVASTAGWIIYLELVR